MSLATPRAAPARRNVITLAVALLVALSGCLQIGPEENVEGGMDEAPTFDSFDEALTADGEGFEVTVDAQRVGLRLFEPSAPKKVPVDREVPLAFLVYTSPDGEEKPATDAEIDLWFRFWDDDGPVDVAHAVPTHNEHGVYAGDMTLPREGSWGLAINVTLENGSKARFDMDLFVIPEPEDPEEAEDEPSPSPSDTQEPGSPTPSPSPSATSPAPSPTPTATSPAPSPSPTATSPAPSPSPTATSPAPSPSPTSSPSASPTPTPTPSPSPSPSPTEESPSPSPTSSPTASPTATAPSNNTGGNETGNETGGNSTG